MFKLGEYDEIEAEEIAEYLRDAGIRVEVRQSLFAERDDLTFMEGAFSEVRDKLPDCETYDKYLETMKNVLAEDPSSEREFRDRFLSVLDPDWDDKRDQLIEIFEDESPISDNEAEDLKKQPEEDKLRWLSVIFDVVKALGFAESILELNEIDFENCKKSLPEDPLVYIPLDPEGFDLEEGDFENSQINTAISIEFDKICDVYLDEMSSPLIDEVDDGFAEDYFDELLKIKALGSMIEELYEPPGSSRKISFDEFKDMCNIEIGDGKFTMRIDGTFVAEDLAKVLEKRGILRTKGNMVKWKKI